MESYKVCQGFWFLASEKLKKYFFSGTVWLPLTGSSFVTLTLLSLSTAKSRCEVPTSSFIESKGTWEASLPSNVATLICTITQEVELRFFRVSKLFAAELRAQLWLGRRITILPNSCSVAGGLGALAFL